MIILTTAPTEVELAKAYKAAIDSVTSTKNTGDYTRIRLQFLNQEIDSKEYNKRMDESVSSDSYIVAESQELYKEILTALEFEPETAEQIAKELRPLVELIKSLDLTPYYAVDVIREEGAFVFTPSVYFRFPDSLPENRQREYLKKVLDFA